MQSFLFWSAVGFAIAVVMTSFFEWAIHRFVMHKPVGKFDYAFRAHAVVHHQVFKADHTYHLIKESDKETIPMAWWNGPVLILLAQIPMLPVALIAGKWAILAGSVTAVTCYYIAYEYIHWCMHLPKKRHVERSGIFFRLNGHHLLHHRYMHKNFNVVFPLADFIMGTLLLRSKIKFAQARGPSVPDVQPRTEIQPPTNDESPEGAGLPAPGI